MSKVAQKTLASCINDAKTQAVDNYDGYELIAVVDVLRWLQESITIELLKDCDIQTVEKFTQDCNMVEDETTENYENGAKHHD